MNATVIALAREGMKPKAIAARVGMTQNAVTQALYRARRNDPTVPRFRGIEAGHRDLTDPTLVAAVKAAWIAGERTRTIAYRLNLLPASVGTIVTRLRRAGQVEGRYGQ